MELKKCLELSARRNVITLIDEGLFIRAYNQSVYIITSLLGKELRINCRQVKKLGKQMIVYVGFPKSQLSSRFTKFELTKFGYEIKGNYEMSGYFGWLRDKIILQQQNAEAELLARAYTAIDVDACANNNRSIMLTNKQMTFLTSWGKNKYPIEVSEAFIESLKKKFTKK